MKKVIIDFFGTSYYEKSIVNLLTGDKKKTTICVRKNNYDHFKKVFVCEGYKHLDNKSW